MTLLIGDTDEWEFWGETDPAYAIHRIKSMMIKVRYGFETLENRRAYKLAEKHNFGVFRLPRGIKEFYVKFYATGG